MILTHYARMATFLLYVLSSGLIAVNAQDSDPFSKQTRAPSAMRTRGEIAASLEHLVPDGLNLPRQRKLCDLCGRGPVNPEHTADHRKNHCTARAHWILQRSSEILDQEQAAERQRLEENIAKAKAETALKAKVENLEKLTEKKAPIEIVSKVDLLKTETSSLKGTVEYLTKEIDDLKTALENSTKNRILEIQRLEKKISSIVYFGSAIAFSLTTFYVYSLYFTKESSGYSFSFWKI